MYSLQGIQKGLAHPRFILQEIDRLWYKRANTWSYNENGINFLDQDWDNLLILDACRYDLFEEGADLPGETSSVRSRGSATREFLQANLDGQSYRDTVYVTASPMLSRHRDDIEVEFHDVVNVWQDEGWDEEYRTVLPETMATATLDAAERYPNKRLFVHFIQPHFPFLGPTGEENFDLDSLNFEWEGLVTGEIAIPVETLKRAYTETFEAVLPSVEQLLVTLDGKTVVTADHGQMFGERLFPLPLREYGHPPGLYTDELVKVPWHEFENGPRREITAEAGSTDRDADDTVVRERLNDLGYLD